MIRAGALLVAAALGTLAAGVAASSLLIVYVSIAVSILAAIVLFAGVLLRREEIFGSAAPVRETPVRETTPGGWLTPRPTGVSALVGGQAGTARADEEPAGDSAGPAGAAPGRGDAAPGREWDPARHGRGRDQAQLWPGGYDAGPVRKLEPREPGRPGREEVARGPGRGGVPAGGDRDVAASARERDQGEPGHPGQEQAARWPGRGGVPAGGDRDVAAAAPERRPAASWQDRESAADRWPEGFRVPPFGNRPGPEGAGEPDRDSPARRPGGAGTPGALPRRVPPARAPGQAGRGPGTGGDLWTRPGDQRRSEERRSDQTGHPGGRDEARPAWPATAGPRAMGAETAPRPPAGSADRAAAPGKPAGERATDDKAAKQTVAAADKQTEAAAEDMGPAATAGEGGDPGRRRGGAGAVPGSKTRDTAARDVGPEPEPAETPGSGQAGEQRSPEEPGQPDAAAGRLPAAAAGRGEAAAGAGQPAAGRDEDVSGRDEAAAGEGQTATGEDQAAAGKDEAVPGKSAATDAQAAPVPAAPADGSRDGELASEPDEPAAGADDDGAAGPTPAGASVAIPADGEVTVVPGVPRYHRSRCILIRFLSDGDVEIMTRAEAESANCVPCKACQPDKAAADL